MPWTVNIPCPHSRSRNRNSHAVLRVQFVSDIGSTFELNPFCRRCQSDIIVIVAMLHVPCPGYYVELQQHMEEQVMDRIALLRQSWGCYSEFVYRIQDNRPMHHMCDLCENQDEEAVIEGLERFPIRLLEGNNDKVCSICLEQLIGDEGDDDDDGLGIRLPCHHEFHQHCIISWLHRTPSCPLCRSTLA